MADIKQFMERGGRVVREDGTTVNEGDILAGLQRPGRWFTYEGSVSDATATITAPAGTKIVDVMVKSDKKVQFGRVAADLTVAANTLQEFGRITADAAERVAVPWDGSSTVVIKNAVALETATFTVHLFCV